MKRVVSSYPGGWGVEPARHRSSVCAALILALGQLVAARAHAETMLEQYAATQRFRAGQPTAIHVADDGRVFYLRSGPRSRDQALYCWDPTTRSNQAWTTAAELLSGQAEQITPEEAARRERLRQTARGITSLKPSQDGRWLLVPLGERLFRIDTRSRLVSELQLGDGAPVDPRLSPDGAWLAFVREGDLYVYHFDSKATTRLTDSASATLTHGLAEFIAQEEMARMHGCWWSPDSRQLVYQQTDESAVELLSLLDPLRPEQAPRQSRYPRAGGANAQVRLGVIDRGGGPTVWIEWDRAKFPYLASVHWKPGSPLTLVVEDRPQHELVVLAGDPATGETRELLREHDPDWLNLVPECPWWLDDGSGFVWATEREGAWRLELRDPQGALLRPLEFPGARLVRLAHLDSAQRRVWAVVTRNGLDTELVSRSLDGDPAVWMPSPDGVGELGATFARGGDSVVVQQSPRQGAPTWTVFRHSAGQLGEPFGALESAIEPPRVAPRVAWVETSTEPSFSASIVRPSTFDSKRHYPVLVHVYGGPGSQMVGGNAQRYLLAQALAEEGFCVVSVDGRGTAGRGRAWERSVRADLAGPALADTVRGLQSLCSLHPELDPKRVGALGWSFGGYLAAMAVMRHPEVFRAGVAGAPVCDWRDYDTHYTERYLGLPAEDSAAYERSSLVTYAGQLRRPLLIVHGTADDNVFFRHGLLLSETLFRSEIEHEFLPLAGQTHVIGDPATTRLLYDRIVTFFRRTLLPEQP